MASFDQFLGEMAKVKEVWRSFLVAVVFVGTIILLAVTSLESEGDEAAAETIKMLETQIGFLERIPADQADDSFLTVARGDMFNVTSGTLQGYFIVINDRAKGSRILRWGAIISLDPPPDEVAEWSLVAERGTPVLRAGDFVPLYRNYGVLGEEWDSVRLSERGIYLYGIIEYEDARTDTLHQTIFCHVYQGGEMSNGFNGYDWTQGRWCSDPSHNDAI